MQCGFVFILPLVFVLTIYVIKGRSSERIMLDWEGQWISSWIKEDYFVMPVFVDLKLLHF